MSFRRWFFLVFVGFSVVFVLGIETASASALHKTPNNLGLAGAWSFEEGNGTTATDGSGRGNTGTLSGFALSGSTSNWVTGRIGRALNFDGSDDYVSVADSTALDVSTSFTMSGWVKLAATGEDSAIFDSGTQSNHWLVQIESVSNKIDFVERAIADNVSNTSLTAGTWYHVVVVKSGDSGTNLTFYLNGQADGTASVGSVTVPSGNKTIGNWTESNAQTFNGGIDEVHIYNRALSATEVAALYTQTALTKKASASTTGLVGYWRLNEGAGTQAYDSTQSYNTGTLKNGATWAAGKFGSGLKLDSTDDYVSIPDSSTLEGFSALTVCGWGKLNNYPVVDGGIVATKSMTAEGALVSDPYTLWGLAVATDGTVNFQISTGSAGSRKIFSTAGTVPLNAWNHLCGTYDHTTMRIYINGNADANTLSASITVGTNSIDTRIGGLLANTYTDVWPGTLDDVRIYSRALSAAEIAALYSDTAAAVITHANTTHKNSLTSGLLGNWTFDGPDLTGATSIDVSGRGNSGTITGTIAPTAGRLGQALKFDGTSNYVDVPDVLFSSFASGFTWSSWVKSTNASGTWAWPVASSLTAGTYSYFQCGKISNSGNIRFDSGDFTSNTTLDTTNQSITDGNWHNLTCVWDTIRKYIYIDGVEVASAGATLNSTAPNYGHLLIGAHSGPAEFWLGAIDDVRVYNRALNPAEVVQLYGMGR